MRLKVNDMKRNFIYILHLTLFIFVMSACKQSEENIITRSDIKLESDVMTPDALWAMGRIGSYSVSPNGEKVAYQVSYYSVEENRSNTLIYTLPLMGETEGALLGLGSSPVWLSDDKMTTRAHQIFSKNIQKNSCTTA